MDKKQSQILLGSVYLLMGIVACALPGQTLPSEPVSNPEVAETSIAGTVQVATNQTEQAGLVTTEPTFIPTETSVPTPVISSVGTSLKINEDGSTLFVDHLAGVKITVPSGWLAIRVGEPEYYTAWEKMSQNPALLELFSSLQNLDPKTFKLDALDLRPENIVDDEVSRMGVVFGQGDTRTLNELRSNEVQNPLPLTNYKLLSSDIVEQANGIQTVVIEIQWQYANQSLTGYRKRVLLKVPGGTIAVDLICRYDMLDVVMPEFDKTINSIELFTP